MSRVACEITEADALLIENAAVRERVSPQVLMSAVLTNWAADRREMLRDGREIAPVARGAVPARAKRLTDGEVARIRELIDEGASDAAIAADVGIARKTVQMHRWKYAEVLRGEVEDEMHAEAMRKEKAEWD